MNRKSSIGARYVGMISSDEGENVKGSGPGGQALSSGPLRISIALSLLLAACFQTGIPPIGGTARQQLDRAEAIYADARDLYFQLYVTEAQGTGVGARGTSLGDLRKAHQAMTEQAIEVIEGLDTLAYEGEDRRAIRVMRAALETPAAAADDTTGTCVYDARAVASGADGRHRLASRIYDCYGTWQSRVVTATDTVDRLTVLARLAREPSADTRRALFLSLQETWRSVNGDNSPDSPWRTLVALTAAEWRRGGSPIVRAAATLGLDPDATEATLVAILSAWRDRIPTVSVEPWDWYYENDAAGRKLSPRIGRPDLTEINDRHFSALGVAPRLFGIRYDLAPRAGKTPVAFTQFGGLPRRTRDGPVGANPWVFATYQQGGFGNLVELLHETGHAIHIASVFARPAFADWPDSDPFTEGLADVPALEAYEPRWQWTYLGDSATTRESLRGKYASIMMDVAWALFELRMHADPGADPNATWSNIAADYLRITRHPEWSWWAMRGQLVDSPGYMMNYALGAMIAAEVRARIVETRGPLHAANDRTYDWLSERLYRWGLERTSRNVLETFLGRRLSASGLLEDLSRM
jgi:hypothetical protein